MKVLLGLSVLVFSSVSMASCYELLSRARTNALEYKKESARARKLVAEYDDMPGEEEGCAKLQQSKIHFTYAATAANYCLWTNKSALNDCQGSNYEEAANNKSYCEGQELRVLSEKRSAINAFEKYCKYVPEKDGDTCTTNLENADVSYSAARVYKSDADRLSSIGKSTNDCKKIEVAETLYKMASVSFKAAVKGSNKANNHCNSWPNRYRALEIKSWSDTSIDELDESTKPVKDFMKVNCK